VGGEVRWILDWEGDEERGQEKEIDRGRRGREAEEGEGGE
jgi:hypothetical protein